MNLTKDKLKAANIAVDVIDLIETKVYETVQDNDLKEQLINSVVELIDDHYQNQVLP